MNIKDPHNIMFEQDLHEKELEYHLRTQSSSMQAFIDELWALAHTISTFDGFDVQELMLKHKLLVDCLYQEDPTDISAEWFEGYKTIDLDENLIKLEDSMFCNCPEGKQGRLVDVNNNRICDTCGGM